MRTRWFVSLAVVLMLALSGCGGNSSTTSNGGSGGGSGGKSDLTVSAAASLKQAFTTYGQSFTAASVRYSFGGSDILAAQIEQDVKPDVFASANLTLPQMLYAKGLVAKPIPFAANKLVLAVPAGSTKVRSLPDLERPGVTLAIGSATVPIGAYTRKVLGRLGGPSEQKILSNVRSEEADVSGIVAKLSEGAVDAGFTYASDVRAAGGKLTAIALPVSLQPVVAYGVAVVKGSTHARVAAQFIAGLLHGPGRTALLNAGFLPPPGA